MAKAWNILKRFLIGLVAIVLLLALYYFVSPTSFTRLAERILYPTVNISEGYANKVILETPEVYELMQIIGAFTETSQNNANLLNKATQYYQEVEQHFSDYSNHEIINLFNQSLVENGQNATYGAARFLALTYNIDDNNDISHGEDINIMRWLVKLAGLKFFTLERDIPLIEDFAQKSNFKQFYTDHKDYYNSLKVNLRLTTDFKGIRDWLESRAKFDYNSYRVIYSPLTGGSHFTVSLKDRNHQKEQVLIFISPGKNAMDTMTVREVELESAWRSRISFTEIDHNYVNPISDRYLDQINDAMSDYTQWNIKKYSNSYESSYATFNEYMTWGLFSLYAKEKYHKENLGSILQVHTDFMADRREFNRFREFSSELLRQDSILNQPQLEALYPPMLEWIKNQ